MLLSSRGPSFLREPPKSWGERAADFDWLVGKWSAIVRDYNDDGTVEENEGYGSGN